MPESELPNHQPSDPASDSTTTMGSEESSEETQKLSSSGAEGAPLLPDQPDGEPEADLVQPAGIVPSKKRLKPTNLLIALLALIGIGLIVLTSGEDNAAERKPAAGSAQATPTVEEEREAAKIGEVADLANLKAEVVRVNRNFEPPDPAQKPPEGQKYFAVEFKLVNNDKRPVKVSAARQFKLRDSSQKIYRVSNAGVPSPRFPDGVVAPGQTVQGWISFQIPTEAKKLKLTFSARVPRR